MLIGLTFDLRDDHRDSGLSEEALAEFDSPETIAGLEAAIQSHGHTTERIGHIRALTARLAAGARWDLVFNMAEGLAGRAREAQVPALLEAFGLPYVFSDPLTLAASLDKAVAKRLVRDQGVPTAPFAVLEREAEARDPGLGWPLFVKPLAEGTSKGCSESSLCADPAALRRAVRRLLARYRQPVLVETFLPGREFTVGILGNGAAARAIGVMAVELRRPGSAAVYSFDSKEHFESRVVYTLADDIEARRAGAVALAAYRALGCRDAGRVDLRSDAQGAPQFLEVNPLAGLHPTHSDLPILSTLAGLRYADLIGAILEAAIARLGLARRAARPPRVASVA